MIPNPSDKRLKTNIEYLDTLKAIELVQSLRPVELEWTPESDMGDDREYGLIAQEVAETVPEATFTVSMTNLDEQMGVRWNQITTLLLSVVQNQQSEIELLKRRLDLAEQRINLKRG